MTYKPRYTTTYEKFKQKVEEMGLSYRFYDFGTNVDLVVGDDFVVTFYKRQSDNISIYLKTTLNSDKIHKLIDFCREMTKAPINKRGELK